MAGLDFWYSFLKSRGNELDWLSMIIAIEEISRGMLLGNSLLIRVPSDEPPLHLRDRGTEREMAYAIGPGEKIGAFGLNGVSAGSDQVPSNQSDSGGDEWSIKRDKTIHHQCRTQA